MWETRVRITFGWYAAAGKVEPRFFLLLSFFGLPGRRRNVCNFRWKNLYVYFCGDSARGAKSSRIYRSPSLVNYHQGFVFVICYPNLYRGCLEREVLVRESPIVYLTSIEPVWLKSSLISHQCVSMAVPEVHTLSSLVAWILIGWIANLHISTIVLIVRIYLFFFILTRYRYYTITVDDISRFLFFISSLSVIADRYATDRWAIKKKLVQMHATWLIGEKRGKRNVRLSSERLYSFSLIFMRNNFLIAIPLFVTIDRR